MKIKLTQDIYVADRFGNKSLRSTIRFSRGIAFQWKKGTVMMVSDATGQKMIDAGEAVKVKDTAAKATTDETADE